MSTIVTREKIDKGINRECIPGYRGGQLITDEDRLIEIASTTLMIHEDIKTLEKACQELLTDSKDQSKFKLKALPSKVGKLKVGLNSIGLYANNILHMTRKLSTTKYNASRDIALKNMENKREAKRKATSCIGNEKKDQYNF